VLVLSPVIAVIYTTLYSTVLMPSDGQAAEAILGSIVLSIVAEYFRLPVPLWIGLVALSALAMGPATCGITYITRNYVRQQHADITDLWDHAKSNLRQGILLGLLDIVVYALLLRNVGLAGELYTLSDFSATLLFASRVISWLALVIYTFMRFYTYQLVVTFDMPLTHILKNAWLFAVLGLFRNLLALAILIVTVIGFFMLNPIAELIFFAVFAFSFWSFTNNFITFPLVQKYMIPPEETADAESGEPGEGAELVHDAPALPEESQE